jgi:putative ABC transport system permease protein
MNLSESMRIALVGLLTNRLRAVLTTLGIIIGVAAVISLVSLGRAVEDFVAAEFESLGSNVLFVFSSRPSSPTRTRIEPITTLEARDLTNPTIAPSIRQIAMEYFVFAEIAVGSESVSAQLSGITPNFIDVRAWYPRSGSFITQEDMDNNARVAVLGQRW